MSDLGRTRFVVFAAYAMRDRMEYMPTRLETFCDSKVCFRKMQR